VSGASTAKIQSTSDYGGGIEVRLTPRPSLLPLVIKGEYGIEFAAQMKTPPRYWKKVPARGAIRRWGTKERR